MLGRYARFSKICDLVSVLRVRTSWSSASLPSPASHAFGPLAPYCYTQLAPYCPLPYSLPPPWVSLSSVIPSGSDALSPVTRDHPRDAVISSSRLLVYLMWLASPLLSGSPRWVAPFAFFTRYAIYSTVPPRAGYGIPWYCTISLDVPKVWCAPITGQSARVTVLPLSRQVWGIPLGTRQQ